MKIYPNDLCPCGSGKKYKKCCMNKKVKQIGNIGSLPVYELDENADFIINHKGAVVFKDETKQPVLEIPEGSIIKTVLSVGFSNTPTPMVTIQENEGAICYRLPDWYSDWCQTCVAMAMNGMNVFPSDVKFSFSDGKYSVDILDSTSKEIKQIQCYIEQTENAFYLRDKTTNKLVSIPSTDAMTINSWKDFVTFCNNYCPKVFDRTNKENYVLFIGKIAQTTDNEIILSPNCRYKLLLEENYRKGITDKEAFEKLNDIASLEFILDKVYGIIQFIETIEEETNTLLIGDRCSIDLPIKEHLKIHPFTYGSAIHRFASWRSALLHQKLLKDE